MEVSAILKKASDKCGCSRSRFKDRNLPTSIEGVTVMTFFGDRRSSFVLSSLLLRRVREELKGSRYFVLISWPGDEGLYPYVDEYWHPSEFSALEAMRNECQGFSNSSSLVPLIHRSLNQYFYDVMTERDLVPYYENGLTSAFFDRFRHVKVSLPSVPSSSSLGLDLSRGLSRMESKVFVRPCRFISTWRNGRVSCVKAPKEFWVALVEHLVAEGFGPVVASDLFSYDLSSELNAPCMYVHDLDVLKSLSVMRSCGCVLDMFAGDSRLAIAARCPFLCFDERQRFGAVKEYEINDLCGRDLQREYIFSFAALVEKGGAAIWKSNLFDHMTMRLRAMHASMDRESWPAPVESNEIVPYDSVRKRKLKKLGSRFIKVERD